MQKWLGIGRRIDEHAAQLHQMRAASTDVPSRILDSKCLITLWVLRPESQDLIGVTEVPNLTPISEHRISDGPVYYVVSRGLTRRPRPLDSNRLGALVLR